MKMFFSGLLLAGLSLLTVGCSSAGKGSSVTLPKHEEIKLQNGLTVLLIKDASLPYVSYLMMVKSGSAEDPAGAQGLSSLVGELLDQGTNKRDSLQLADSLGQMGARFSVSTFLDYTMITASGLSYHQDTLLTDFSEIVTQPSFPQKEVNRIKNQRLSELRQTVDNPGALADVAFDKYLYGEHPYGRRSMGSLKDVQKINKREITRYYLQNFRPNNSVLAVVGQFDSKEMRAKLEDSFKEWGAREISPVTFAGRPELKGLQIQLLDKPDLKQSQVRIGHIGITRNDPDFLNLRVANTILGGAFASRLMKEIREKRGLTYSISSGFSAYKDNGPFEISTFTRHEKVKETVETTLGVLKTFKEQGVTEQEVEDAKSYLVGSFPRSIETPESLAMNMLILRYYGISDAYLKNYVRDIRKISANDVNRAIRKHISADNLKVLVFSPRSQSLKPLKELGEVEVKSFREFL